MMSSNVHNPRRAAVEAAQRAAQTKRARVAVEAAQRAAQDRYAERTAPDAWMPATYTGVRECRRARP